MSYVNFRGARFGGHSSFSAGAPMTDDDLRRVAPSIFATEPHESRSARFAYIPTVDILAGLRREGFVPVRAIQGKCRIPGKADFTKHMIRLQHPDFAARAALGGVAPESVLVNAHDGTSSYLMFSGVIRSICTNSMIVMQEGSTEVRVPHKGDVVGKVIDGSFEVIAQSRLALDQAEAWSGITLEHEESAAFAEAAHVLRFGDADGEVKTPIAPGQLLQARRREDQGADLWRTMNRVQENVIRGGLHGVARDAHGRRRNATTRAVNGIDQDVKLNRALWHLAARMAELKAVA